MLQTRKLTRLIISVEEFSYLIYTSTIDYRVASDRADSLYDDTVSVYFAVVCFFEGMPDVFFFSSME